MKEDYIDSQVTKIYDLLVKGSKIIDDWSIIEEDKFKQIKSKIITNINNIDFNKYREIVILAESKKEYFYIKYNSKFISIVSSPTEYGLLIEMPKIYAVNINVLNDIKPKIIDYSPKYILKLIGFKLNKKAIKDLAQFT